MQVYKRIARPMQRLSSPAQLSIRSGSTAAYPLQQPLDVLRTVTWESGSRGVASGWAAVLRTLSHRTTVTLAKKSHRAATRIIM